MVSTGYSKSGRRGQVHFKQMAGVKSMRLFQPTKEAELLVSLYNKPFDLHGNLVDEVYKNKIRLFLDQFDQYINKNTK